MINSKERLNDEQEGHRNAMDGALADLWTALPAIITAVNYDKQTLSAQPAIQAISEDKDGNDTHSNLPLLVDVPFQSFGGSGFVVTVPNLIGAECLIVFSSRCIDGWWSNGGTQPQMEERMHDLSDGMAILGFNSQKRLIPNYSQTDVEMRTFDGSTKIGLTGGTVTITAANLHVTGSVQIDGAVTTNSTITAGGDVKGSGTSLHTHTHMGNLSVPTSPPN